MTISGLIVTLARSCPAVNPACSMTAQMFLHNLAQTVSQSLATWVQPGSIFSVQALLSALAITLVFYSLRKPRPRLPHPRAWRRLLLPEKFLKSRSVRIDLAYYVINTFVTGSLIGWAVLSLPQTSQTVTVFLNSATGPHGPLITSPWIAQGVMTLVLFLAYDFSYWLDHYLKHVVPILWPFHRVHHTAELLTPMTATRVHPVDTLIFVNIQVLIMGAVNGALHAALGDTVSSFTLGATNVIVVAFLYTVIHLQHSHVPIRFTGIWGRIFFSPVHHHIHHSADPAHYGRNLGSCLALWDGMFGTLYLPERLEGPLAFGAESEGEDPHSLTGGLLFPFLQAAGLKRADAPDRGAPVSVVPVR